MKSADNLFDKYRPLAFLKSIIPHFPSIVDIQCGEKAILL